MQGLPGTTQGSVAGDAVACPLGARAKKSPKSWTALGACACIFFFGFYCEALLKVEAWSQLSTRTLLGCRFSAWVQVCLWKVFRCREVWACTGPMVPAFCRGKQAQAPCLWSWIFARKLRKSKSLDFGFLQISLSLENSGVLTKWKRFETMKK